MSTQMPESVGPDIKQTFILLAQNLCNVRLGPCANTAGDCVENSQQVDVLIMLQRVQPLHTVFHLPVLVTL